MIFVTVGIQLPFDRLIRSVDGWAASRDRHDVIAQIGRASYRPSHITAHAFVEASEFLRLLETCEVLVAHAGIGSILSALDLGKPVLVMPRRASLGEHRNEHQMATVRNFAPFSQIRVTEREEELPDALDDLLSQHLSQGKRRDGRASQEMLQAVGDFLGSSQGEFNHAR